MTTDITAQVTAWAADEISKQALGEEYGFAVTLGVAVMQTPQGPAQLPMWTLLITARNPLLGEGPLYHGPVPVGSPRPEEKDVRAEVTKGLDMLRGLAVAKVSGLNGHAKAPV